MQKCKCPHCKNIVTPDSYHNCSICGQPLETVDAEPDESKRAADFADQGGGGQKRPTPGIPMPNPLPIVLEYRHTYCCAGQHGSIPLRLTNRGHGSITEVELNADKDVFSSCKKRKPRKINLPPNAQTHFLPLDFDLRERWGTYPVELKGYYCDEKGNPNAFCGVLQLVVRNPARPRKFVFKGNYGGDLENLDFEAYDEVCFEDNYGLLVSVKNFINESNGWLPVELEEDFERTIILKEFFKEKKRGNPPGDGPPSSHPDAQPFRSGLLTFTVADKERRIHIWSDAKCILGRNKPPADIVCIRIPMNAHNQFISGRHCLLEVRDNRVWLSDGPSRNGTFVDNQRIEATTPLSSGQTISLARKMGLEFRAFRQINRAQPVREIFNSCSNLSDVNRSLSRFNLKHASRSAPLECYRLRRTDDFRHKLSYVFLHSAALVGASPSAAVQLNHATVSPLHARLLYKDQTLFIEDLDTPTGTMVNGTLLKPYEPCILNETAAIQMGDRHLHFRRLES